MDNLYFKKRAKSRAPSSKPRWLRRACPACDGRKHTLKKRKQLGILGITDGTETHIVKVFFGITLEQVSFTEDTMR